MSIFFPRRLELDEKNNACTKLEETKRHHIGSESLSRRSERIASILEGRTRPMFRAVKIMKEVVL